jgi:tetratricopeptide (TPR) repeat protein
MRIVILLFLFLTLFNPFGYSQESDKEVDWERIEYHLYKTLRSENPETSEAEIHQAVGYAFLKSDNQFERAAVRFKKAVAMDPKLYFSWYNLGLINADEEKGRNYFKKCIEVKPDFSPAYYWLGYSLCRQRRDKEALPVFEKYLVVARGDPQEKDRLKFASKLVKELRCGKEGKNLSSIRISDK